MHNSTFSHQKPVQETVLETVETKYNNIATIDQSVLEFSIPAHSEFYIDPNIHIYVSGQLLASDGKALDANDHTAGTNNFLHSLFSQCSVSLNGTVITQSTQHYNYRSTPETLLTYASDAVDSHLTNSFCYRDVGDMKPCDPTAPDATNPGFVSRWQRCKQSKILLLYGRLYSDLCNVPLYLLTGVRVQIKLTKVNSSFYLMKKDAQATTQFKFLDAKLYVKRIRANLAILLVHNETLKKGILARYNMTSVELKTFNYSSGAQSLTIDSAVLGNVLKRLLFTM
jgi:hypothetical protein